MHAKIYFQKILFFGLFLSLFLFAAACGDNAKNNEEELLKKDGQTLTQLSNISVSLKANRLTSEDFETLKKIREKYPNSQQIRQIYLNALFIRKDWQAIAETLSADSSKQLTREENNTLAKAYFKLGEYRKTIDILAPLPEKDFETKSVLGQSYFQLGETENAAAVLEEIKDEGIANKKVDGLSILGLVYLRQNNFPKALEILKKAVELDSEHIPSNNALSLVYARQGDKENAEAYRQRTAQLQKKATEETFENSLRVQKIYELETAWNAKNYDEVIKLANETLTLTDNKNEKLVVYQYLFESYKAIGNEKEAENAAAEAQKLQQ